MRVFQRRLLAWVVILGFLGTLLLSALPVAADDLYFTDNIVYPNPRQYTSQTVNDNLSYTDDGASPIGGATVCTIYHFKTTDSSRCGTTDENGNVSVSYYISGASRGYVVGVDITADIGYGASTIDTLYFSPE